MKVFVSLDIPDVGIDMLRDAGLDVKVWDGGTPMLPDQLAQAVAGHDILLSVSPDRLNARFLENHSHLKLISQFAAGYDNIDTDKARELGIAVANAPGAMVDATADIAFALMLAVSRKLLFMHKQILGGGWGVFRPKANLGMELRGKTVGIFGMGRIGAAFAQRCSGAYNMDILYHNRHRDRELETALGALYVPFEELLERSDVLSVHAALTPETAGRFDKSAFARMKPSSIFINTARGGLHNEKDLTDALTSGHIWGAGLDVTNPEPMHPDNPLLQKENVAISPHIGSATTRARDEMSRLAAQNILEFVSGKPITNRVV